MVSVPPQAADHMHLIWSSLQSPSAVRSNCEWVKGTMLCCAVLYINRGQCPASKGWRQDKNKLPDCWALLFSPMVGQNANEYSRSFFFSPFAKRNKKINDGVGGNESKIRSRGRSPWREFSMCKVSTLASPPCAHKSPQKLLEKGVYYLQGTS